jgi:S-adenosylmethionine:tRNA ribosyltransferase-isomerase
MQKRLKTKLSLEDFDYTLPPELIAKAPQSPRDTSRLFVYDTKNDEVTFDVFRNIGKYLPPKTLLVFNNTKVIPARLYVTKETGGKAEILILLNEEMVDGLVKVIADRQLPLGKKLFITPVLYFTVVRQDEQYFFLAPSFPIANLQKVLLRYGVTPLPPYIKKTPLKENEARLKYQSVLAKYGGSVAAPTASLHFTKRVLSKLLNQGVEKVEITLHVGMGTFAPINEGHIKSKTLFKESFEVTPEAAKRITEAKKAGYTIIPVGTTSTRTLESIGREGVLRGGKGQTDIFITPPFSFKVLDGLITNFHVPKSSLMMLVEAVLKSKGAKRGILDLYTIAKREKFRFYSFGDAMLII